MLFFLATFIFLVYFIKDDSVRRFIYACVLLICLRNIYNFWRSKNENKYEIKLQVQPDSKIMAWVNKPLKLCNTILDSERYSNILYVNKDGNITIYLDSSSIPIDLEGHYIYYRYIMNGNKMSKVHKVPLFTVEEAPMSQEPQKLPIIHPKKIFDKELKTMEKIDKLTVRRSRDITLEPIDEEDSSDLDSVPDDELDKYFKITKEVNFTRPLEAILNDRNFNIKTI